MVQCDDWGGGQMFECNLLLLKMIVAPVLSEGVSSLWCLGSFLDLMSIPWLRTCHERMSWSLVWWSIFYFWKRVLLFGLCWTGLWCWHHDLCHPSHRWTHCCVWPILLGIGLWCHPFSSERYLGSSWVQMVHEEIYTCQGVCWRLWGVKLPLPSAFQRRPCCHPPWKIWLPLWVHGLSPQGLEPCGSHGWWLCSSPLGQGIS